MRESRTYGFVRGAPSNMRPYRDPDYTAFFGMFRVRAVARSQRVTTIF